MPIPNSRVFERRSHTLPVACVESTRDFVSILGTGETAHPQALIYSGTAADGFPVHSIRG